VLLKIRHAAVKVRCTRTGASKFTGAETYSVVGSLDGKRVRLALGTEEEKIAIRRIEKIKTACAVGPTSPMWTELEESLPVTTFDFFAKAAGYVKQAQTRTATAKPSWTDLCDVFELEMKRLIANKQRGATSEEGIMSESTRDRYRQTVRHFTAFLVGKNTLLDDIKSSTIELFKVDRARAIDRLKQSRGGSSIALDIAVLHRMFAFAVAKKLMDRKPIDLRNESKPGKNPKNGARPFTAQEIESLREHAGQDLFTFLLLRWTGLRGSDAVNLQWRNVHLDRGQNGEIEVLTQKRSKTAIVPLSTELRNAIEEIKNKQAPEDFVLHNPETEASFSNRKRLYERMKALGERSKVSRVTPHCFRDTFACDMLARGASIYDVAKMLADTVDTVEKHYASFIPAARDAAQSKMDNGIGIEERAKLSKARDRKVVAFPASA
jgi:integrase/recombinase XerC